ncbi:MAG TPA: serine/threonine-protein kinase [Polyangiaceae bacterium]|nr:serine/threonine-protein kinase [Polyangiaceae bacterium]
MTPSPLSGTRTSHAGSPPLKTSYSVYVDEESSSDSGYWYGSDLEQSSEDHLVGGVLSNTYKVTRILGEGGMGRVYEAHHTRIASKRFAVKALHPEFARRKDVLLRFQREVEAAASINSPYVVGVYDVGETDDGRPYLVSELLEGEELGDYLDKVGMMSISPAVRIVRQVCKALAAAHACGVVHRDIKPENVFLSGDAIAPSIKVLDFGISRLEGKGGNTLTKTGMVMGTPSYMSPEQARGERVDHRTDIYAAGAILYRAVTGKIPFDKDDATATLAAVLMEEPDPPRAIAPHIPETLELIIQRAMARNPGDRYQEIEELDAALAPFDEEPGVVPAPDPSLPGRRPRMASQLTMDTLEHERAIQGARPQLVLLAVVIALGVVLSIMGLATGIIRLGRDPAAISGTEALVIALVVVAGLATPMVLMAQHIRKNLWRNTAKVVEVVQALREPLLIGLATTGMLAIAVRVLETTVLRTPMALSWPVWDLLVPSAGVFASLFALWYRRGRRVGGMSGAVLLGAFGALLAVSTMVLAMTRDDTSPTMAPAAEASGDKPVGDVESVPAGDGTPEPAKTARPQRTQAAYDVWKELYDHIRKRKITSALDSLEKLMQLDPTALEDKDVRDAVLDLAVQAFYQENEQSDRMAHIASQKMGAWGPDLLYEIMVTRGATQADRTAQQLLADESVRARGSQGMQVAYAIRKAKGCEDKKAAIIAAKRNGDHRAVREISIAQRCSRRAPCCLRDDEDVDAVLEAIKSRQQR